MAHAKFIFLFQIYSEAQTEHLPMWYKKKTPWQQPQKVPTVIHTKAISSVIVLKVVSKEFHVMLPDLFPENKINATTYIKLLDIGVKPWIEEVAKKGATHVPTEPCYFQCGSCAKECLVKNFHNCVIHKMWLSCSPYLNPLDESI